MVGLLLKCNGHEEDTNPILTSVHWVYAWKNAQERTQGSFNTLSTWHSCWGSYILGAVFIQQKIVNRYSDKVSIFIVICHVQHSSTCQQELWCRRPTTPYLKSRAPLQSLNFLLSESLTIDWQNRSWFEQGRTH